MNEGEIVIVDDDEGHALLIESGLRDAGVDNPVRWFADGYAALESLLSPDEMLPLLVLLDLNMPGIGGLEVLKQLRAAHRTRPLPVVMLTTSPLDCDVEECYRLGCNLYVTKPIRRDEFVRTIGHLGSVFRIARMPEYDSVF